MKKLIIVVLLWSTVLLLAVLLTFVYEGGSFALRTLVMTVVSYVALKVTESL